jgi:hypothetical protein
MTARDRGGRRGAKGRVEGAGAVIFIVLVIVRETTLCWVRFRVCSFYECIYCGVEKPRTAHRLGRRGRGGGRGGGGAGTFVVRGN